MNTTIQNMILHEASNFYMTWDLMHFKAPLDHKMQKLLSGLSTTRRVLNLGTVLRSSSCAVVGASSSLSDCPVSSNICKHDIVIHVNDHPEALKLCPRADIQFVNQHTCFWKPSSKHTPAGDFYTQPASGALRKCGVNPRIARIRHEWNPTMLDRFARGALLSSGVINRVARNRVGKCCASAGGVAVSFALESCRSVTAFGLAGVNRSHFDSRSRMPALHDLSRELQWMLAEERHGRLKRVC